MAGRHDPRVSLGGGRGGTGGRAGHGKQEGEAQKAAYGEHGGWDGDDVVALFWEMDLVDFVG